MRKSLLLLVSLMFFGCGTPADAPSESMEIDVNGVNSQIVIPRELNEICGKGYPSCNEGLICIRKTASDENFICKVHDTKPDLECDPSEWARVCAERDGVENTYQNSCYAEKGGAQVLYAGTCEQA